MRLGLHTQCNLWKGGKEAVPKQKEDFSAEKWQ